MKKIFFTIFIFLIVNQLIGQTDTLAKIIDLNEVIISANKVAESKRTISQQIRSISSKEISLLNAQNAGDLLAATGLVMVQKSQQGGSSPILRGFEASRVLFVVDGVRMNNLIYRGGHLQNVITVDQNMLERAEIIFGPASTVYGSDALGGVVHFHTKSPQFSTGTEGGLFVKGSAFTRYSSSNNEKTGHFDLNIGEKRLAWLASVNYSDFGDLRMGTKTQALDTLWRVREYYVEPVNGKDVRVKNDDIYLQKFSGYTQYDILQKMAFKASDNLSLGLNVQLSNSSNVPRYDRLTDTAGVLLSQAEWYYGPQKRFMTSFDVKQTDKAALFQNITFNINFQDIEESRHTRGFGRPNLTSRIEKVQVLGANLDFQRTIGAHDLRTGIDGQRSQVKSTAFTTDASTNIITPNGASTRYPDGDNSMLNAAVYVTHTWKIDNKWTLNDGIRLGTTRLKSTFINQTFFKFPFTEAQQSSPTWSGNLGIIYAPKNDFKASFLLSSGFRVPNVDDLTKVFDTQKGLVTLPNPDVKPERTVNGELGLSKSFGQWLGIEGTIYYTNFTNAIVVDDFTFNGQDSILYDGVKSKVIAPQNKGKATIWGTSLTLKGKITEGVNFYATYNFTKGTVAATEKNAATPLDHVPPAFGRIGINYIKNTINAEIFSSFSAWKRIRDYRLRTEDNEAYATKDGMPSWWTLNVRIGKDVWKGLKLQVGIENIFDTQYRVFASGIHASGRNFWGTIRYNF